MSDGDVDDDERDGDADAPVTNVTIAAQNESSNDAPAVSRTDTATPSDRAAGHQPAKTCCGVRRDGKAFGVRPSLASIWPQTSFRTRQVTRRTGLQ